MRWLWKIYWGFDLGTKRALFIPEISTICWKRYQAGYKHTGHCPEWETESILFLDSHIYFFPIYLVKAKSLGIVNTQKRYPNLRLATNLRLTILNSSRWTDKKQQTLPESMGWHNPYFTEYHTGLSGTSDRNIYELGNKSCLLLMEVGSGSIFIPESYVYRDTTVLCMNVKYQTLKWP